MRRPNFFILGAPKCGTTSLAAWLADHPNIYMSPKKEPTFFNTDHAAKPGPTRQLPHYESFFASATDSHVAIGEATPVYLYSDTAVPNILRYTDSPLFIVCLRNPVDLAYSLHDEYLFQGAEHIVDFAQAWKLSDQRMQGKAVKRRCREPKHLAYNQVCLLGEQVERLLTRVSRNSVHFVILDDVVANPRNEYLKVLHFLGVEDDGRKAFPNLNPAKTQKWPLVKRGLMAAHDIRRKLGIHRPLNLGIQSRIEAYNRVERTRREIPPMLRRELQQYFCTDVIKLGRVVGRDLSGWVKS